MAKGFPVGGIEDLPVVGVADNLRPFIGGVAIKVSRRFADAGGDLRFVTTGRDSGWVVLRRPGDF